MLQEYIFKLVEFGGHAVVLGGKILYAETLKGMGIPMSNLGECNMSFHGIIPGKKAESLGQIALDVVFGDSKNYRKEKLTFEVVDFQSTYHVLWLDHVTCTSN